MGRDLRKQCDLAGMCASPSSKRTLLWSLLWSAFLGLSFSGFLQKPSQTQSQIWHAGNAGNAESRPPAFCHMDLFHANSFGQEKLQDFRSSTGQLHAPSASRVPARCKLPTHPQAVPSCAKLLPVGQAGAQQMSPSLRPDCDPEVARGTGPLLPLLLHMSSICGGTWRRHTERGTTEGVPPH